MKLFSDFLMEEEQKEPTSGTYAKMTLSDKSRNKLSAWLKEKNFENLVDPSEYHVTIVYSRKPVPELANLNPEVPINVNPIGWEIFGKDHLLVLKLEDSELTTIFNASKDMGATYDFAEYIPHISVAKNYEGDIPKTLPDFKIKLDDFVVEKLDLEFEYTEESE